LIPTLQDKHQNQKVKPLNLSAWYCCNVEYKFLFLKRPKFEFEAILKLFANHVVKEINFENSIPNQIIQIDVSTFTAGIYKVPPQFKTV
jgi:hypothetical protein